MPRFAPSDITPDITHDGERVSPDVPNALFLAHLSIYRFAGRWATGAHVLDAGCGTGYGAAWLADHGAATVLGVDVDPAVIAHAARHAARPGVSFAVADLAGVADIEAPAGGWDLIVSSNALEHVWGVDGFFCGAWARLSPGGTVIVAVPGVVDDASRVLQMANRYHLNIWSPEQWRHALARYFADVVAHRHWLDRADFAFDPAMAPDIDPAMVADLDPDLGPSLDLALAPAKDPEFAPARDPALGRADEFVARRLDEADFAFEAMPPDDLRAPSLSHVFVARGPRRPSDVPAAGVPLSFIDASFSRRPPRLTPLPPAEATATVPVAPNRLPAKALRLWRQRGAAAVVAEARQSIVWRFRRRYALRLLRQRPRGR